MWGMLANVITPMMALGCWQLLFGNVIIGVIEARVVARFRSMRRRPPYGLMIGANYLSALVGLEIMPRLAPSLLGPVPIERVRWVCAGMVVLCLVLSILLEYPFVYAALARDAKPRPMRACIVAQLATYLLLLIPCWMASDVLNGIQLAPVQEISRNPDATVLYIADDGDIYRVKLDGSRPVKYRALGMSDGQGVLDADVDETGRVRLAVGERERVQLLDDAPELAAGLAPYLDRGGSLVSLAGPAGSEWQVRTGASPWGGLVARNRRTDQIVRVAVSAPGLDWWSRRGRLLPGDQVVFELNNHILLVDLETRRVAVVAIGRGPMVLMPQATTPTTQPSTQPGG